MKVYLSGQYPGEPEIIEAHVANCPFCNQEPTGIKMEDGFHMIRCYNGHDIVVDGNTAEEVIAAWNAGRDPAKLDALLEAVRFTKDQLERRFATITEPSPQGDLIKAYVDLKDRLADFEGGEK